VGCDITIEVDVLMSLPLLLLLLLLLLLSREHRKPVLVSDCEKCHGSEYVMLGGHIKPVLVSD